MSVRVGLAVGDGDTWPRHCRSAASLHCNCDREVTVKLEATVGKINKNQDIYTMEFHISFPNLRADFLLNQRGEFCDWARSCLSPAWRIR